MKSQRSKFYTVYFWVVAAMLFLLTAALITVYCALKDYETGCAQTVAQNIENTIKKGTVSKFVLSDQLSLNEFESPDRLDSSFAKRFNLNKIKLVKSSASGDNTEYRITEGGKNILVFDLVPGKKSFFGFDRYKLNKISFTKESFHSVTVHVPKGYTLSVNGKKCTQKYVQKSDLPSASSCHMPPGVQGVLYDVYVIEGLINPPKLSATAPDGANATVTHNSDGAYNVALPNNQTLQDKYSSYIITATMAYAKFMQCDATFAMVQPFLKYGTPLYAEIATTLNQFVADHDGYRFENPSVSEFYAYSDTLMSCRVCITQVLKKTGSEDYRDPLDITFYLEKNNNGYLIYDMQKN